MQSSCHDILSVHAQLAASILQPERLREIGERTLSKEAIQKMWPIEVAQKGFIDFLREQYDHTQLEAIEVSLCSLRTIIYGSRQRRFQLFILLLCGYVHDCIAREDVRNGG